VPTARRRTLLHGLNLPAVTVAAAATSSPAVAHSADSYPNKPVRLVVGYPLGGTGGFIARVVADWLLKELGGQVLVESQPGEGGTIANERFPKAAPDGYIEFDSAPFALTHMPYRKLGAGPEFEASGQGSATAAG
jgi:tripartite-type tricarboxylate transporter receptor subunit TctC